MSSDFKISRDLSLLSITDPGDTPTLPEIALEVDKIVQPTFATIVKNQESRPLSLRIEEEITDYSQYLAPSILDDSVIESWYVEEPMPMDDLSVFDEGIANTKEDFTTFSMDEFDHEVMHDLEELRESLDFSGQTNLLPYIWNLGSEEISDTTAVKFEDGQILPLEPGDCSNQNEIFIYLLSRTYGQSLSKIASFHGSLRTKSPLLLKDIKEALVSIAANVRVADLKALFRDIKRQTNFMLASLYLSPSERAQIGLKDSFSDLTTDDIALLEKAFRTLPSRNAQIATLDLLYDGGKTGSDSKYVKRNEEILLALKSIPQVETSQRILALSEYHGKQLGYVNIEHGMFFPMVDSEGKRCFYEVVNKLSDLKDGVIGTLLAPLGAHVEDASQPTQLTLNFRGTQPTNTKTNSGASIVRDLDIFGVGATTFEAREDEIILMLRNYLAQQPNNVHLNLHGHSLGGCDVQRAMELIVRELAKSEHDPAFDKIAKISIFAHNPPGVEMALNYKFSQSVQKLDALGCAIPIELNYILFEGDPVQSSGEVYLGAAIFSPNVERRITLIKSTGKSLGPLQAHTSKAYVNASKLIRIDINDKTSSDMLEKLLQRGFYWNPNFESILEQIGRIIVAGISTIVYPIKLMFEVILYGVALLALKIHRLIHARDIPSWYIT